MIQPILDIPQYGPWMVTDKGDRSCRMLADRHYSRQHIGHPMFTRPGRNLVLRTVEGSVGKDSAKVYWPQWLRHIASSGWQPQLFGFENILAVRPIM